MNAVRHVLGLALVILIGVGLLAAWLYYPDFVRWEPIRPYRAFLVEWRLPILAVGGFLVLTFAEWAYGKALHRGGRG